MTPKRESICRICGDRLSFQGSDKEIHWKNGGADDFGLVCAGCIPIAKLERIREELKKKEGM